MSVDIWAALIGFFTACIGAGRWLLAVNHKNKIKQQEHEEEQQERIEKLKSQNQNLMMTNIDTKVKSIQSTINEMKLEIVRMRTSLDETVTQMKKHDSFAENMKKFIIVREQQMKNLQSVVVDITEDLKMIKTKKS